MVLVAGENVVDIGRIEPARVDLLAGRVAVRVVCKQVALPADPAVLIKLLTLPVWPPP
jgi:hypothetical protein